MDYLSRTPLWLVISLFLITNGKNAAESFRQRGNNDLRRPALTGDSIEKSVPESVNHSSLKDSLGTVNSENGSLGGIKKSLSTADDLGTDAIVLSNTTSFHHNLNKRSLPFGSRLGGGLSKNSSAGSRTTAARAKVHAVETGRTESSTEVSIENVPNTPVGLRLSGMSPSKWNSAETVSRKSGFETTTVKFGTYGVEPEKIHSTEKVSLPIFPQRSLGHQLNKKLFDSSNTFTPKVTTASPENDLLDLVKIEENKSNSTEISSDISVSYNPRRKGAKGSRSPFRKLNPIAETVTVTPPKNHTTDLDNAGESSVFPFGATSEQFHIVPSNQSSYPFDKKLHPLKDISEQNTSPYSSSVRFTPQRLRHGSERFGKLNSTSQNMSMKIATEKPRVDFNPEDNSSFVEKQTTPFAFQKQKVTRFTKRPHNKFSLMRPNATVIQAKNSAQGSETGEGYLSQSKDISKSSAASKTYRFPPSLDSQNERIPSYITRRKETTLSRREPNNLNPSLLRADITQSTRNITGTTYEDHNLSLSDDLFKTFFPPKTSQKTLSTQFPGSEFLSKRNPATVNEKNAMRLTKRPFSKSSHSRSGTVASQTTHSTTDFLAAAEDLSQSEENSESFTQAESSQPLLRSNSSNLETPNEKPYASANIRKGIRRTRRPANKFTPYQPDIAVIQAEHNRTDLITEEPDLNPTQELTDSIVSFKPHIFSSNSQWDNFETLNVQNQVSINNKGSKITPSNKNNSSLPNSPAGVANEEKDISLSDNLSEQLIPLSHPEYPLHTHTLHTISETHKERFPAPVSKENGFRRPSSKFSRTQPQEDAAHRTRGIEGNANEGREPGHSKYLSEPFVSLRTPQLHSSGTLKERNPTPVKGQKRVRRPPTKFTSEDVNTQLRRITTDQEFKSPSDLSEKFVPFRPPQKHFSETLNERNSVPSRRRKGDRRNRRPTNKLTPSPPSEYVTEPINTGTHGINQELGFSPPGLSSEGFVPFRSPHFPLSTQVPDFETHVKQHPTSVESSVHFNSYSLRGFNSSGASKKITSDFRLVTEASRTNSGAEMIKNEKDETSAAEKSSQAFSQSRSPQYPVHPQPPHLHTVDGRIHPNGGFRDSHVSPIYIPYISPNDRQHATHSQQNAAAFFSPHKTLPNPQNEFDHPKHSNRGYGNRKNKSHTLFPENSKDINPPLKLSVKEASVRPKTQLSFLGDSHFLNEVHKSSVSVPLHLFDASKAGKPEALSSPTKEPTTPLHPDTEFLKEIISPSESVEQETHVWTGKFSTQEPTSPTSPADIHSEFSFPSGNHSLQSRRFAYNIGTDSPPSLEINVNSTVQAHNRFYDPEVFNERIINNISASQMEYKATISPQVSMLKQGEETSKVKDTALEEATWNHGSTSSEHVELLTNTSIPSSETQFYSLGKNAGPSKQPSDFQPLSAGYHYTTNSHTTPVRAQSNPLTVHMPFISSPMSTIFDTSGENGQYYHYVMKLGKTRATNVPRRTKIYSTGNALYKILNETGFHFQTASVKNRSVTPNNKSKVIAVPFSLLANIVNKLANVESYNNRNSDSETKDKVTSSRAIIKDLSERPSNINDTKLRKINTTSIDSDEFFQKSDFNVSHPLVKLSAQPDKPRVDLSLLNSETESYSATSFPAEVLGNGSLIHGSSTEIPHQNSYTTPSILGDLYDSSSVVNPSSTQNSVTEALRMVTVESFVNTERDILYKTMTETPLITSFVSPNETSENHTIPLKNDLTLETKKSSSSVVPSFSLGLDNSSSILYKDSTTLQSTPLEEFERQLITIGYNTETSTTSPTGDRSSKVGIIHQEDGNMYDRNNEVSLNVISKNISIFNNRETEGNSNTASGETESVLTSGVYPDGTFKPYSQTTPGGLINTDESQVIQIDPSETVSEGSQSNINGISNWALNESKDVASQPMLELVIQNSNVNDFVSGLNNVPVVIRVLNPRTQTYHSIQITPENKSYSKGNTYNNHSYSTENSFDNIFGLYESDISEADENKTETFLEPYIKPTDINEISNGDIHINRFSPNNLSEPKVVNIISNDSHQMKAEIKSSSAEDFREFFMKKSNEKNPSLENGHVYEDVENLSVTTTSIQEQAKISHKFPSITELPTIAAMIQNYTLDNLPFSVTESVVVNPLNDGTGKVHGDFHDEVPNLPKTIADIVQPFDISAPENKDDPIKKVFSIMENYKSPKKSIINDDKIPIIVPLHMESPENLEPPNTDKPLHLIPIYFKTDKYETPEESQRVYEYQRPDRDFNYSDLSSTELDEETLHKILPSDTSFKKIVNNNYDLPLSIQNKSIKIKHAQELDYISDHHHLQLSPYLDFSYQRIANNKDELSVYRDAVRSNKLHTHELRHEDFTEHTQIDPSTDVHFPKFSNDGFELSFDDRKEVNNPQHGMSVHKNIPEYPGTPKPSGMIQKESDNYGYHAFVTDTGMEKENIQSEKSSYRSVPQFYPLNTSSGNLLANPANRNSKLQDVAEEYSEGDSYDQESIHDVVSLTSIDSDASSDILLQEATNNEDYSPIRYVEYIPYVEPDRITKTSTSTENVPPSDKFMVISGSENTSFKPNTQNSRNIPFENENGYAADEQQQGEISTSFEDELYPVFKPSLSKYGRHLS